MRLTLLAVVAVVFAATTSAAHAWNCPPGTHDTGHSCAPNTPPPKVYPPKPVTPPVVQPPVVVPPVFHQPAGRWGYCDANGVFVDLEKGQTTNLPPGIVPPLRDADVDKIVEGTQVNARCDVKTQAVPPTVTVTPPPTAKPAPPVKKKTPAKPPRKHKVVHHPKKPKVCKPGTRMWHGNCAPIAYGKG